MNNQKLIEKISSYIYNFNIEEVKKEYETYDKLLEFITSMLYGEPNTIISILNENLEQLNINDKLYGETNELIKEIKNYIKNKSKDYN